MTRREFLATAAAVAGATGVGHTQTPRFRISLAQWSLHRSLEAREIDHLDFVTCFGQIPRAGHTNHAAAENQYLHVVCRAARRKKDAVGI